MQRAGCILGLLLVLGPAAVRAQGTATGNVAGNATGPSVPGPELLTLTGRGVQVYRCAAPASVAPAWILDHPEAELLDARGKVVGHHSAGPIWQLDDGSMVKGEAVEKTPAPEPDAIPWLLVRVTVHQGAGALASVALIRRTGTRGGVAPVQGCDAAMVGAMVRVPYSATYTFYGQPVR